MPNERLPKLSMENCRKESAHSVTKRNATKTHFKLRLRISIFQLSPGNRLHRTERGVVSSKKELHNLNKKEYVKIEESVKNGKQEPWVISRLGTVRIHMLYMQPTV